MNEAGPWFAWHPIIVRTNSGAYRWTWLTEVYRTRFVSPYGAQPYRYFTI